MKKSQLGMHNVWVPAITSLFFLFVAACTCSKTMEPEEVVRNFVRLSVSAKGMEDKEKLMDLCGGAVRGAFESISDDDFKKIYLVGGLTLLEFRVLEQQIEGDAAKVSYVVRVENTRGNDDTSLELNEREVSLLKQDGKWKIGGLSLKGADKISFTKGMVF